MSKDPEVVGKGEVVALSPTKMNSARTAFLNARGKMSEHKGVMGDVIKNKVEPAGCETKAFKLAVKLADMSPEKRGDFLRSFDQLREFWKLDVDDLFDVNEADNDNEKQVDVKSPDDLPDVAHAPGAEVQEGESAGPTIN